MNNKTIEAAKALQEFHRTKGRCAGVFVLLDENGQCLSEGESPPIEEKPKVVRLTYTHELVAANRKAEAIYKNLKQKPEYYNISSRYPKGPYKPGITTVTFYTKEGDKILPFHSEWLEDLVSDSMFALMVKGNIIPFPSLQASFPATPPTRPIREFVQEWTKQVHQTPEAVALATL